MVELEVRVATPMSFNLLSLPPDCTATHPIQYVTSLCCVKHLATIYLCPLHDLQADT